MVSKLDKNKGFIILVILLGLVLLIGWSYVKNNGGKTTEGMMNIDYDMMPPQATNAPEFDYDLIYGDPTDGFGMGAGASEQTTNDWTLL